MPIAQHEVMALVDDLSMRRTGDSWNSGCPLCGGEDRFFVSGNGLFGCRQCGHDKSFFKNVKAHVDMLLGNRPELAAMRDAPASAEPQPPKASLVAFAANLWRNSVPAEDTPAHTYLMERRAWPPPELGIPLPSSVKWVPAPTWRKMALAAKRRNPDRPPPQLPDWADGAMVCRYSNAAGQGVSVSCEALTEYGERPKSKDRRFRRTFGSRRDGRFNATEQEHDGPDGTVGAMQVSPVNGQNRRWVVVAEGEVSALAAALIHPTAASWAAGSTAMLPAVVQAAAGVAEAVLIEPDADPPDKRGQRPGAIAIERTLDSLDDDEFKKVSVGERKEIGDVADELADAVRDYESEGMELFRAWMLAMRDYKARDEQERPTLARPPKPRRQRRRTGRGQRAYA